MPVFHQIGHDSENLLSLPELDRFAGAILSPLNYTPGETQQQISELKESWEVHSSLTRTFITRRVTRVSFRNGATTRRTWILRT